MLLGCRPSSDSRSPTRADLPSDPVFIVDASRVQFLGAAVGQSWLPFDRAAPWYEAGEPVKLYELGRAIGETTAGELGPVDEFCTAPRLVVDRRVGDSGVIGVSAHIDALPRPVRIESTDQPEWVEVVAAWLRAREIASPEVQLQQVVRVDIEGDGSDEVLLVANRLQGMGEVAHPGDYGLVLLRAGDGPAASTLAIRQEVYPQGCSDECLPMEYEISGVLDLNGDGDFELVVTAAYYEGEERTVVDIDESGPRDVLGWACGL